MGTTGRKNITRTWKTFFTPFRRFSGVSAGVILVGILMVLFILSFAIGRYPISPGDVVKILASHVLPIDHTWPDILDTVVMHIRLPRILAAMLVGASLALAGASFQGLFRNPLVSPDILGVSSGAGFGAAAGYPALRQPVWLSRYPPSASPCWRWASPTASARWSKATLPLA